MTAKGLIDKIKGINISSHDIPILVDMKEIKGVNLIGNDKFGAAILISTGESIKINTDGIQHRKTKGDSSSSKQGSYSGQKREKT